MVAEEMSFDIFFALPHFATSFGRAIHSSNLSFIA